MNVALLSQALTRWQVAQGKAGSDNQHPQQKEDVKYLKTVGQIILQKPPCDNFII